MALTAGAVIITVGVVDPATGLGPVVITGAPGPNLALELAQVLFTSPSTTVAGGLSAQNYFNHLATVLVTHIKLNAQVVVTNVTAVQAGAGVSGPGTGTIS